MPSTLHTLLRLRGLDREASAVALRKAEDERDSQRQKLDEVRATVARARENVSATDAADLAVYHQFRLRQEMAERREMARLAQKERDLETKRNLHVGRVRDELALQNVIDAKAVEEARDESRRDQAQNDEVAARRLREGA
jgi:flagellar export protein FliJ